MAQKEQQMLAAYNLFSAGGLSYDARHTQFSLEMPLTNMLVTPEEAYIAITSTHTMVEPDLADLLAHNIPSCTVYSKRQLTAHRLYFTNATSPPALHVASRVFPNRQQLQNLAPRARLS